MRKVLWMLLPLIVACGSDNASTTGSSSGTGAGGAGGASGASGASSGSGQSNGPMYANPVLPGDFPDPSVIHVGDEYWASATSSQWGPPFPLLRSKDLVNWELTGSIFAEAPSWVVEYFWAPELSEDKGKFYVFYTARQTGGPLCVAVGTADSPAGPYTDHGPIICQAAGSIDGFSIRDEKDVRYLIWKEDGNSIGKPTVIWAQPLSDDGTKLQGEKTALFQNEPSWEDKVTEGPFVLKNGDYFYAFYSGAGCCGLNCSYAFGVARSKTLLGPWEKHPDNPILRSNDAWKCPGHGSIVAGPNGRHFLLYHAYSTRDTVYVGRQGMLDEVIFGSDGWPSINGGKGPSVSAPAPIAEQAARPSEFFDDFTGTALAPGWQWPVGYAPKVTIDATNGGRLVLPAMTEGPGNHAGAAIARSTQSGEYEATTEVTPAAGVRAGLAAFGDVDNALGLSAGDGQLILYRLGGGVSTVLAQGTAPATVQLRLTAAQGHLFSFSSSADGGATWQPIGAMVDDSALPPWDRGVRVALTAAGPVGASASFESFRLVSKSSR